LPIASERLRGLSLISEYQLDVDAVLGADDAAIASVTAMELLVGVERVGDAHKQARSVHVEAVLASLHALSMIAGLPALEYLALLDGAYTEHGLRQLARLPKLRHLHVEREGLSAPMFRFAAAMPALTKLTGLDEFGDDGPMPPAQVQRVRVMLPRISLD
jgi:hypothetical protein